MPFQCFIVLLPWNFLSTMLCMVRLSSLLWIRTIHLQIPSMFISSIWDVKEPTHFWQGVGHGVPDFVAARVQGGDIPHKGHRGPVHIQYHLAIL